MKSLFGKIQSVFKIIIVAFFGFMVFTQYVNAQPANDLCVDAIEVFNGVTAYNNINAGPSTPFPCGFGDGSDVWFEYTATCTGEIIFETCNNGAQPETNYDSVIEGFYTDSCASLDLVMAECNDDDCGSQSAITLDVIRGDTYLIHVGGYDGSQGEGHLEIIPQENCIVPPQTIDLSPSSATNDVLTDHTVTAIVLADEVPDEGVLVTFQITSGPNTGEMSDPGSGECAVNNDCTTDGNGRVSWTYSSELIGTDTIVASVLDEDIDSNPVEKIWVLPPRNIPTLSEWGLIAMAVVLGIVGLLAIRRRKVTA